MPTGALCAWFVWFSGAGSRGVSMSPRFPAIVRAPLIAVLGAALAGCGPNYRLDAPSRLCVELPSVEAMDVGAEETKIRGLDPLLRAEGFVWSSSTTSSYGNTSHDWRLTEPKGGSPDNAIRAIHYKNDPARHGQDCRLRLDFYADRRQPHGEREWRVYFELRDRALPALFPEFAVRVVDHPAFATWAWEVPALAARFAPDDTLPLDVRERIDAYENRSAVGRWLERTGVAMSSIWGRTVGPHLLGASMYFLFPLNWVAFLVFAAVAAVGRRFIRSPEWRARGFVAFAVVALMPVMVPTFVGAVYMPHGFVQVYDFDPHYYFREPGFATVAALITGLLAWWLLRLRRRSRTRRNQREAR